MKSIAPWNLSTALATWKSVQWKNATQKTSRCQRQQLKYQIEFFTAEFAANNAIVTRQNEKNVSVDDDRANPGYKKSYTQPLASSTKHCHLYPTHAHIQQINNEY